MPARLEITQLATFCAIAELKSFSRAAAVVHRSQAAVSQQIQVLETAIGAKLFERSARGVALTAKGEKLVAYAREILSLHDEAIAAIIENGLEGTLRLGLPDDYADAFLPMLITGLRARLPRVRVKLLSASTPILRRAVDIGEVDLAIVTLDVESRRTERPLRFEPLVWIARPDSLLADSDPLPIAISHRDAVDTHSALTALKVSKRRFEIVCENSSAAGILAAVKAGVAVAVVARCAVPSELSAMVLRTGLPELGEVAIDIVSKPDGNPLVQAAVPVIRSLAERW